MHIADHKMYLESRGNSYDHNSTTFKESDRIDSPSEIRRRPGVVPNNSRDNMSSNAEERQQSVAAPRHEYFPGTFLENVVWLFKLTILLPAQVTWMISVKHSLATLIRSLRHRI